MHKILVVVDMQNDFITGSLGTKEAKEIIPGVANLIRDFNFNKDPVVFTRDTHEVNYKDKQEGKRLPIEHCIINTEGWHLHPDIMKVIDYISSSILDHEVRFVNNEVYDKNTFGSLILSEDLCRLYENKIIDEIHFVGLCTDICVISNAVITKAYCPEARIVIHKDLCAGTTPKAHERALETMKGLQMDIV